MKHKLLASNATFSFTPHKDGRMVTVSILRAGADKPSTKRMQVDKARAIYKQLRKKGLHKA